MKKYKRNIRIVLRPDQQVNKQFILDHNCQAGLFTAPGTGKTIVAIRSLKQFVPGLVVCRRDDFLTWKLELIGEGIPESSIYFIDWAKRGSDVVYLPSREEYNWCIVTYDLLKVDRIHEWVKKSDFNFVIADEVHMIKRWKSARTKATYLSTRQIPRKVGMTGTPITNTPLDVYSICLFIDGGKTFGTSEFMFLKRYYLRSGPGWYLHNKAKKKIGQKLKNVAVYVHEDSVLKLPPTRHILKSAPMSGMQRRHYEALIETWETEVDRGEIIEINQVVARLQKLKQIASGFIYDEQHQTHYLTCPKFNLLFELLKDPDYFAQKPKIVIWCAYTAEINRIIRRCSNDDISFVSFFGGTGSRKQREYNRLQFRDDPSIRIFVGQVDMGIGINELVGADTAIWYSNSLKVISRQQSERRTRRQGSHVHKEIINMDLITENTVEVGQLQAVKKSMSLASYILDQINEGKKIRTLLG